MTFQAYISDTPLPEGRVVLMRPAGDDVEVFIDRQALLTDPKGTVLALLGCASVRLDHERRLRAAS